MAKTADGFRLICQLLEWEKALHAEMTEPSLIAHSPHLSPPQRTLADRSSTDNSLGNDIQSFAKREADDLDERMRARRSKRRKSDAEGNASGDDERE